MKKFFFKPGFEFIFSISIIVILGLPPVLLAQTQKDLEIRIENGDTTINGKNIKDLSAKERNDALKDINHLSGRITINIDSDKNDKIERRFFFKRRDSVSGNEGYVQFKKRRPGNAEHEPVVTENIVIKDSVGNIVETRRGRQREMDQTFAFKYRNNEETPDRMRMHGGVENRPFRLPAMRFEPRNSQNFDYMSTDKQGFSTHVSFHVSDSLEESTQKSHGGERAKLEINDLSLLPVFTSGKTLLMFSLPSKSVAEVYLKDGEGKLLWSEKSAGGNFSKSFTLGLNGIYYLHIKQGNSDAVKKILKEE